MAMHQAMEEHFEWVKASSLTAPFYSEVEHASEAPVMTKADLVKMVENNFDLNDEARGVYLVRSGGTAQAPLIFPVDIEENFTQRKRLAQALVQEKIIEPTTISLNLFNYEDLYRSAPILDHIMELCQATTLPMSLHSSRELILRTVRRFRPDLVMATPSALVEFARWVKEQGALITIDKILFAGESLSPFQRRFLEETYHSKTIFSLYGAAETGIWAWSEYSARPGLFRILDGVVIEIIRPDADGFGTIAVTNLIRRRFPLFRYGLGDIGRFVTCNGVSYLELKCRESMSFLLDSDQYYLDDLKPATQLGQTFQLQIKEHKLNYWELKLLLVEETLSQEEKESRIRKATDFLRAHFNLPARRLSIVVQFVEEKAFHIHPASFKTPRIADFRR